MYQYTYFFTIHFILTGYLHFFVKQKHHMNTKWLQCSSMFNVIYGSPRSANFIDCKFIYKSFFSSLHVSFIWVVGPRVPDRKWECWIRPKMRTRLFTSNPKKHWPKYRNEIRNTHLTMKIGWLTGWRNFGRRLSIAIDLYSKSRTSNQTLDFRSIEIVSGKFSSTITYYSSVESIFIHSF